MNDYFTIAEYRALADDLIIPYEAEDDDVMRAQSEVIERLEAWGRSAWPNVTLLTTVAVDIGIDATNLEAASGIFTSEDVGKTVRIVGAGTAAADLTTTITAFVDASNVTIASPALTTVTGAGFYMDGDGTASSPRSTTRRLFWRSPLLNTQFVPLIDLTTFQISGTEQDQTLCQIDTGAGTIRWGDWSTRKAPILRGAPTQIDLAYTYGFLACPASVKRPCMQATRTLLMQEEDRGGIPRNVERYQTDGTTFNFNERKEGCQPWPWDEDSSDDIRSFWMRRRPRRAASVDIM